MQSPRCGVPTTTFSPRRKKYDASQALVTASEEAYNANLESHRHGLATITDLIGAERDLMAARYTLVQNKAGLLVSSSALVHAVGAESAPGAPVTLNSTRRSGLSAILVCALVAAGCGSGD